MKRVIIIGASSGIGYAVAEALASRGVRVGLAARHTHTLHALKERYPDNVEYESIDVTHRNAPKLLADLIARTGGMDIYFHVSGIGYANPELDPQREADIVATNSSGFARMIAAAYSYFRDNGVKGRIAAVTSVAGTNGMGRLAAYSASKVFARAYLVAIRQLAHIQNVGITVTDIRPGWVRTPLLHSDESYPMELTVDEAVPQIIRALVKHPRVAYIDWRWGIVSRLWRMIPDRAWEMMDPPVTQSK